MIVPFSHQSCIIEGNSLGSAESQIIWEKMNQDYNIDDLQHEEAQLPEPKSLLDKPGKETEVVEIRNHLLATYYLYNTLLKSEQEINIDNIKKIHRILLKDTPQERVDAWSKIQHAGMFRTVSMQAAGYHLTVYPVSFSLLIPACLVSIMAQFVFSVVWRGSTHVDGKVRTILQQDRHQR